MNISVKITDERVADVHCDAIASSSNIWMVDDLRTARLVSALACRNATTACKLGTCGRGYGIHLPEIDEDLSTDGLLRGIPAA